MPPNWVVVRAAPPARHGDCRRRHHRPAPQVDPGDWHLVRQIEPGTSSSIQAARSRTLSTRGQPWESKR
jgi:hypothetical protein